MYINTYIYLLYAHKNYIHYTGCLNISANCKKFLVLITNRLKYNQLLAIRNLPLTYYPQGFIQTRDPQS